MQINNNKNNNNMNNFRFYSAKERKNDFIVKVEYLQWGITSHTTKKSVLKGKKILGMKAWDITNPNYKTEDEFNKQICKNQMDLFPMITVTELVYQ